MKGDDQVIQATVVSVAACDVSPHKEPQPQPQAQPAQAPVVAMQPPPKQMVMTMGFSEWPQGITCQWCHAQGMTNVKKEVVIETHLIACGICLVGCYAGCCLIPYCADGCKAKKHYCPSCNRLVGVKKVFG